MTLSQISQNSILRISDHKTVQLIELYKKEECLWNTNIPDYKDKEKRQKATERIAKALGVKHFDSKFVVIKFKNLRSSYAQELKKIANSEAAGDNPVYRPRVFWFSKMEFIRPHIQLYKSKQYSKTHKESEVSVSAVSEEEEETVHKVKVEYDDSFCYEEHNLDSDEPQEKRMKIILAPKEPPKQKNDSNSNPLRNDSSQLLKISRIPDSLGNTLLPPVIITKETLGESSRPLVNEGDKHFEGADKYKTKNLPQDVKLSPDSLNEPRIEDCFDNFGKYVAAMMKNMSVQRALELQPKIVEMLVSAVILDNQEDLNNLSDSEKS